MPSTARALPFVLIGAFAVLLAGGITLSLATAPPFADQQLQNAAAATIASPSFAIVVTNSVSNVASARPSSTQPVGSETLRVLYRAPDAVQETLEASGGSMPSVIVIGDRLFRQSGSTWIEVPQQQGVGARAVTTIMSPLQVAVHATHVTHQASSFSFESTDLLKLSKAVLGVDTSQLSSPRLTASIRGGFVTRETITVVVAHQDLTLDLVFSAIGSAPPVTVPHTFGAKAPSGLPSP